jgi:hypothetical protein
VFDRLIVYNDHTYTPPFLFDLGRPSGLMYFLSHRHGYRCDLMMELVPRVAAWFPRVLRHFPCAGFGSPHTYPIVPRLGRGYKRSTATEREGKTLNSRHPWLTTTLPGRGPTRWDASDYRTMLMQRRSISRRRSRRRKLPHTPILWPVRSGSGRKARGWGRKRRLGARGLHCGTCGDRAGQAKTEAV